MSPSTQEPADVQELRQRLRALEAELTQVRERLASLGCEETLPGTFLLVDTAKVRWAVPAEWVREVVPLVETRPLPGSAPHVLGTFIYRGVPSTLIDFGALVGGNRVAPVEARVLMLDASTLFGAVVDRVVTLVSAPRLVSADGSPVLSELGLSSFVAGFVKAERDIIPLLAVEALAQRIEPSSSEQS